MACTQYTRLRQIYEVAVRRWGQVMLSQPTDSSALRKQRDHIISERSVTSETAQSAIRRSVEFSELSNEGKQLLGAAAHLGNFIEHRSRMDRLAEQLEVITV